MKMKRRPEEDAIEMLMVEPMEREEGEEEEEGYEGEEHEGMDDMPEDDGPEELMPSKSKEPKGDPSQILASIRDEIDKLSELL